MFDLKLSPSKLAYYEACPVFWQEPYQKSEAAEEGDRLHEAVEKQNPAIMDDPEQQDAVKQCIAYVQQLAPNRNSKNMVERDNVLEEHWLESDIGKRGRADLLIFPANDRSKAHVVDFKFGKQPVEHASVNAQGVDYAYRVFRKWPEIQQVTVHFIMPRQRDVTWHEFDRTRDFEAMRQRILDVHKRYNDPFKQPTPNLDKACNYCGLKPRCPALAQNAVQLAKRFELLPLPEDFAPQAPRTPAERGIAQELADLLIKWAEEIKKQNTQAVLDGAEAEGFRVQSRRGNTSIASSLAFAQEVAEKYELSLEDLVDKAGTISFSKTLNLLREYNPSFDAAELRQRLESDFGHLVKTGPQISFLARERKGKKKEVKQKEQENIKAQKKLFEETQSQN